MDKVINFIDTLNEKTGKTASWCTAILVVLICYDVTMRYLFSSSHIWLIELEWHIFALIFLLSAAYALNADRHVRVDLFYAKWHPVRKAWIDIIFTILFLIPWAGMVIYTSYNYALNSFSFNESSPDPGGLPARYVIKFAITVGFFLLLLQAISQLLKNIRILRSGMDDIHQEATNRTI